MIRVTLPQLSISMEEGKVVRWLVADGEQVRAGQPLVEIDTDKATMEVEAPVDGTLRVVAAEGAVLAVESTLAEIAEAAEAAAEDPPKAAPTSGDGHRVVASPAARRVAAQRGVDLTGVRGSGPAGRIMVRDLPEAAPAAAPRPGLREAVVANIAASWRDIPHIHIGGELDGSGLAAAKRAASEGVGVTDLLILATVLALHDVPELNGTLGEPSERVNLALAVAARDGVVAPVLRNANELSLVQVSIERARLVGAAREGTLRGRDLAGATFTLSNLGAYPVDFFAPVVSGPQIAMLATGRLAEKPVAIDGMLAVRYRLWVNIAIDHRGADGEAGARFLAALEKHLVQLPTTI